MDKLIKAAGIAVLVMAFVFVISCDGSLGSNTTYYTVTFDSDGGGAFAKQTVAAGGKATFPGEPEKVDYVFLYWALDGENEAYDFNTPVNSNITLAANWVAESEAEYWQVSWVLNSGAWPVNDNHAAQVVKGGTLAAPAAPVKADSTFDGWYKEAALTNKVNFPYDVSGVTADFTLYAKWKANGQAPTNDDAVKVKISGGNGHSLQIDSDGNLWAWGLNDGGQLGDGTTTDKTSPVQVKAGTKFSAIAAAYHSLAIDSSGNLWVWGWNDYGQIGDGTTNNKNSPIQINAGTKFSAIAAKGCYSLAIDSVGNLWAWGWNNHGQLGDGTTTDKSSPIQIKTGTKFSAIAAGYYHSLAIDSVGNLWAWGWNNLGQLGDGTTADKSSPIQIKAGTKFSAIAAGAESSFAIDSDGNLWAWGHNDYGQLGDGTTTNRSLPVLINNGTRFSTITAGFEHCVAIDTDGNLWEWGCIFVRSPINTYLDPKGRSYPIEIKVRTKVLAFAAGSQYSLALDSGGNLRAWGSNEYGQLGNGTTTDVYYPVWGGDWEWQWGPKLTVGSYYYSDGSCSEDLDGVKTCTGIVSYVSSTGGLVVSLDETERIEWANASTATFANNVSDGSVNQGIIQQLTNWQTNFPAFAWCAAKGEGWYMPSINELTRLMGNVSIVNQKLPSVGGTIIEGSFYWSSSEYTTNRTWASAWSTDFGFVMSVSKIGSYANVRAVYNIPSKGTTWGD